MGAVVVIPPVQPLERRVRELAQRGQVVRRVAEALVVRPLEMVEARAQVGEMAGRYPRRASFHSRSEGNRTCKFTGHAARPGYLKNYNVMAGRVPAQ
jgi:hypothetical protein